MKFDSSKGILSLLAPWGFMGFMWVINSMAVSKQKLPVQPDAKALPPPRLNTPPYKSAAPFLRQYPQQSTSSTPLVEEGEKFSMPCKSGCGHS